MEDREGIVNGFEGRTRSDELGDNHAILKEVRMEDLSMDLSEMVGGFGGMDEGNKVVLK